MRKSRTQEVVHRLEKLAAALAGEGVVISTAASRDGKICADTLVATRPDAAGHVAAVSGVPLTDLIVCYLLGGSPGPEQLAGRISNEIHTAPPAAVVRVD